MVAIVNVILGFALAVYLGAQSRNLPILRHFSAVSHNRIPRKLKAATASSTSVPKSSPAVESPPPPKP
jgi:hypothetical protein